MSADEFPRPETTVEGLAKLKPAFITVSGIEAGGGVKPGFRVGV